MFPSVEQIESFSQHLDKVNSADIEAQQAEEDELLGETTATDTTVDTTTATDGIQEKNETNKETQVSTVVPASAVRLSKILEKFVELSRTDGRYHLCEHRDMVIVSNWLHTIPLSIPDRWVHYMFRYIVLYIVVYMYVYTNIVCMWVYFQYVSNRFLLPLYYTTIFVGFYSPQLQLTSAILSQWQHSMNSQPNML